MTTPAAELKAAPSTAAANVTPRATRRGAARAAGGSLSERAFLLFLLGPGVVLLCAVVLYPLVRSLVSAFFDLSGRP